MLRKKAAEELKKEQERKAAERRKIIDQRCGQPKNLEGANEGTCYMGQFQITNTLADETDASVPGRWLVCLKDGVGGNFSGRRGQMGRRDENV